MRILIADDHEMIRKGVRSILSNRPDCEVCGEAIDGSDAVEKAQRLKPDLVLMDISMPNLNGLEATREILRTLPQTKIIILSQHESGQMVEQAFKAGARGYVVKSSVSTDLLKAIDKVTHHELFIAQDLKNWKIDLDATEIIQQSAAQEQAIRESEELFRTLADTAPVLIWMSGPDGKPTFLNKRWLEFTGLAADQLTSVTWTEIVHPNDEERCLQTYHSAFKLHQPFTMEHRMKRADGEFRWFLSNGVPRYSANGQFDGFIGTSLDITDRKRNEQAQFHFTAIVESSDDAIISKDLNGIITSWNLSAQRMFGFSSDEAIGRPIDIIIPSDLQHEENTILSLVRNGEHVKHFETIRRRKDGSLIHVSLTISPIKDSQGRVIGASKVARDISDRKKSEEEMKGLVKSLEDRVVERTQDLMKTGHQLRDLSARLLRTQDDERRRIARELHDGVGQVLAAISMNISKVAHEKSKLSKEAARCVDENCDLIRQISTEIGTISYLLHPPLLDEMGLQSALKWYIEGFAERSKISVNLQLPPELGRLPRDCELALFRIVQECLTNIHRHSQSPTALVWLDRTPTEIKLEVRDNGKGIVAQDQSQIDSGKSAGVGMRGMRERLRLLQGTLEVQSGDSGTSIRVVLPIISEKLELDGAAHSIPRMEDPPSRPEENRSVARPQAS